MRDVAKVKAYRLTDYGGHHIQVNVADWATPPSPATAPSINDLKLIDHLMTSLEELQEHASSAMTSHRPLCFSHATRSVDVELQDGANVVIRVVDTCSLPFSFDSVTAAVWRQRFTSDGVTRGQWEAVGNQTYQGLFSGGNLQGEIAMRRIDSFGRVTILRSGFFASTDSAAKATEIRNYQWAVIVKPLADEDRVCQMLICDTSFYIVTPGYGQEEVAQETQLQHLVEAYVDMGKRRLDAAQEAVDNSSAVVSPKPAFSLIFTFHSCHPLLPTLVHTAALLRRHSRRGGLPTHPLPS